MRHAAQKCFRRWGCCSTILATSLGRGFWNNLESSMGGFSLEISSCGQQSCLGLDGYICLCNHSESTSLKLNVCPIY